MQGMSTLLALPLLRTEEPETLLYNGNIWTVDDAQPRAQAVAIRSGRLLAVGSNAEVLPLATARTRKIDLAFKSVLPGFNDAHAHPVESGVQHLRKNTSCFAPARAADSTRRMGARIFVRRRQNSAPNQPG